MPRSVDRSERISFKRSKSCMTPRNVEKTSSNSDDELKKKRGRKKISLNKENVAPNVSDDPEVDYKTVNSDMESSDPKQKSKVRRGRSKKILSTSSLDDSKHFGDLEPSSKVITPAPERRRGRKKKSSEDSKLAFELETSNEVITPAVVRRRGRKKKSSEDSKLAFELETSTEVGLEDTTTSKKKTRRSRNDKLIDPSPTRPEDSKLAHELQNSSEDSAKLFKSNAIVSEGLKMTSNIESLGDTKKAKGRRERKLEFASTTSEDDGETTRKETTSQEETLNEVQKKPKGRRGKKKKNASPETNFSTSEVEKKLKSSTQKETVDYSERIKQLLNNSIEELTSSQNRKIFKRQSNVVVESDEDIVIKIPDQPKINKDNNKIILINSDSSQNEKDVLLYSSSESDQEKRGKTGRVTLPKTSRLSTSTPKPAKTIKRSSVLSSSKSRPSTSRNIFTPKPATNFSKTPLKRSVFTNNKLGSTPNSILRRRSRSLNEVNMDELNESKLRKKSVRFGELEPKSKLNRSLTFLVNEPPEERKSIKIRKTPCKPSVVTLKNVADMESPADRTSECSNKLKRSALFTVGSASKTEKSATKEVNSIQQNTPSKRRSTSFTISSVDKSIESVNRKSASFTVNTPKLLRGSEAEPAVEYKNIEPKVRRSASFTILKHDQENIADLLDGERSASFTIAERRSASFTVGDRDKHISLSTSPKKSGNLLENISNPCINLSSDNSQIIPSPETVLRKSADALNISRELINPFVKKLRDFTQLVQNTTPKKDKSIKKIGQMNVTNSSTKKIVPKKLPNFSLIHKKANAKLESISQFRERKEKRAQMLLSGQKPKIGINSAPGAKFNPAKKQLNYEMNNTVQTNGSPVAGPSNPSVKFKSRLPMFSHKPQKPTPKPIKSKEENRTRFGFKSIKSFTKEEQIKAVASKTNIRTNNIQDRRNYISGVRSNKRFELLMELRKKKK